MADKGLPKKGFQWNLKKSNQKVQSSRELPQSLRVGRDSCETKVSPGSCSLCKLLWGFLWDLLWPLAPALCIASKPAGVRARTTEALGATTGRVATSATQQVSCHGEEKLFLGLLQSSLCTTTVQVQRACKKDPSLLCVCGVPVGFLWGLHEAPMGLAWCL